MNREVVSSEALREGGHTVYILKSIRDGSFYVGSTDNLDARLKEHNSGRCRYTVSRIPWRIHWFCVFGNKIKALRFEKYLKIGSGFAFRNKHLL